MVSGFASRLEERFLGRLKELCRFYLHNGVISSHNGRNRPFSSSQSMPINIGIEWREARCGAGFPGDASEVAHDSRRSLTFHISYHVCNEGKMG